MAAEDKDFNLHSTSEGTGAASALGSAQVAGNNTGDKGDVIDVLQDLAECSHDGEYGFRACAEQAERSDLKSFFLQRADECRAAAAELNDQIRTLGGNTADHGTAAAALHRGWVAVKATLSTYDDKAVLEECEKGEDNAKARYTNAMKKPLPGPIKAIVERQLQGVQRNHDQVRQMRDQARAAS
ncbi:PA2169 family four-helix-bundle protein [Caenimonas sp. SL110]|uniref:PA2169 family four-helix-bundle protein n=1 Tax=Caenimonas sp. SL110 TaxID=1450524 RepID=UPI00069E94CE|nr:PA2169 family four-helix-bundle protein [Caenimonas sp. SL110]